VTEFTPSGIYEKSHTREAPCLVNVAFEKTEDPELTIDSERVAPTDAAEVIVKEIRRLFDGT